MVIGAIRDIAILRLALLRAGLTPSVSMILPINRSVPQKQIDGAAGAIGLTASAADGDPGRRFGSGGTATWHFVTIWNMGRDVDRAHYKWNSDHFSDEDRSGANDRYSNGADGARQVGSYMVAPDGTFRLYDPATRSESVIGNVNNISTPTPTPPQP